MLSYHAHTSEKLRGTPCLYSFDLFSHCFLHIWDCTIHLLSYRNCSQMFTVSNWLQIQCLLSILTLVLFLIVYDTWLLVSPSFPYVFFFLFSLIFILFTGFTCSSYSSVELFSKVLCLVSLVSISSLSMIFSINHPNVDIFKYDSSSSLGTENTLITAYQNLAHGCLTSTLNARYSHYYHPHTCLFSDLWMTELPLCPFSPFHFSILFLISTFSPFASLIIT